MYNIKKYIGLTLILVVIDQLIKLLVRANFTPNSFIEIIPNLIHLTWQENKGISFSFLANLPPVIRGPFLAGISLVVIVGILIYVYKSWDEFSTWEKVGFSLIISGAIGNLIDRAIRQQVTDYMYFHFYETSFFVNNLADDLISIGFVLLIFQSVFKKKASHVNKKTRPTKHPGIY